MFIDEIKSALGTKYANFGLSKEAVDRIALQVEKTVENEDEVATKIASFETMNLIAQEVQKMRDRELRKRADLQKSFDAYKESHPDDDPEPKPGKGSDEEPEWAKSLREQMNAFNAKIKQQDDEAKFKVTLDYVKNAAKRAGCTNDRALKLTEKLFTKKENESDEDAAKRFEEEYNANVKEYFGEGVVPAFGSRGDLTSDESFHSAMAAYAESRGFKTETES